MNGYLLLALELAAILAVCTGLGFFAGWALSRRSTLAKTAAASARVAQPATTKSVVPTPASRLNSGPSRTKGVPSPVSNDTLPGAPSAPSPSAFAPIGSEGSVQPPPGILAADAVLAPDTDSRDKVLSEFSLVEEAQPRPGGTKPFSGDTMTQADLLPEFAPVPAESGGLGTIEPQDNLSEGSSKAQAAGGEGDVLSTKLPATTENVDESVHDSVAESSEQNLLASDDPASTVQIPRITAEIPSESPNSKDETVAAQRVKEAEERAHEAETRAHEADQRVKEAEARVEEAEQRAHQSKVRADEADRRALDAEQRAKAAQARVTELEQKLSRQEIEMARLESRATTAWDTTMPQLIERIEGLEDELARARKEATELQALLDIERDKASGQKVKVAAGVKNSGSDDDAWPMTIED